MQKKHSMRIITELQNPRMGFFYTVRKNLYKGHTGHQKIELIDTHEFGKVLLLDNVTQVVEKNEYQYHEPMVHPALCSHPAPEQVLVIGGGDCGILREVLKYSCVKRVVLAELDEAVLAFSRKYLKSIHRGCFSDPRVEVAITDGRQYVQKHPGEFDVVIMDMTDPFGPSAMLYTREFFKAIKRSFRNRNGIFVMHSESPQMRPKAFGCILKTLGAVFKHVSTYYLYIQMYGTLWSISVNSDAIDVDAQRRRTIDASLKRNGLKGLKLFNGATHRAMLVPYPYINEIRKRKARVITDARPTFPDEFERYRVF
jgi:spermidine synthase